MWGNYPRAVWYIGGYYIVVYQKLVLCVKLQKITETEHLRGWFEAQKRSCMETLYWKADEIVWRRKIRLLGLKGWRNWNKPAVWVLWKAGKLGFKKRVFFRSLFGIFRKYYLEKLGYKTFGIFVPSFHLSKWSSQTLVLESLSLFVQFVKPFGWGLGLTKGYLLGIGDGIPVGVWRDIV